MYGEMYRMGFRQSARFGSMAKPCFRGYFVGELVDFLYRFGKVVYDKKVLAKVFPCAAFGERDYAKSHF